MPPRMITAMPLCSIGWPISGNRALEYRPISTPEMPPRPAAANDVSMNRPSTLMPSSRAAFGDSAIARSARPSCVFFSVSISTVISTNDSRMMPSSSTVTLTPAICSESCGSTSLGKRWFSAPNVPCTRLFIARPRPIVAIIGIRWGASRLRSGLSTRRSISRPTAPENTNANTMAAHSGAFSLVIAVNAA